MRQQDREKPRDPEIAPLLVAKRYQSGGARASANASVARQ